MYFCSQCSYLFNISKSTELADGKEKDKRIIIDSVSDILKKLDEKNDLSKYKASFSKEDLNKNKKYQKLSDIDKLKINQLFEDLIISGAEFKCENCENVKKIKETTLLYQINVNDNLNNIKSLEENKLICLDPLLPHTRDYICKNPDCKTHKNSDIRDSVFYKENNSYKVNYICAVCYYNW
jgi:hypothetical protein